MSLWFNSIWGVHTSIDEQKLGTGLAEEGLDAQTKILYIIISVSLVLMAGLMSGLTIGLMAMDEMEMEVLRRSGDERERMYAAAIAPLLKNHHFLLCTLVLWNAASMEALPLFLDQLADPVTAVILSVTVVLIFGEIVPQGVCTRYGLAVGYYASWLVRILMFLAAPVAWPLGRLLDAILGHSPSALSRGQLAQYVSLHGQDEGFAISGQALTSNETKLINSAMELTSKTAKQAMTPLDKVFMISVDAVLDVELRATILRLGHSRVPVHAAGDRKSIVGLILVKELLMVKEPCPVSKLNLRSLPALSASMPIWDLLQLFRIGRTHMAVLCEASEEQRSVAIRNLETIGFSEDVYGGASTFNIGGSDSTTSKILQKHRNQNQGEQDMLPAVGMAYEDIRDMFVHATIGKPVGVITLEDVVEELLGTEIIDETDRFVDNLMNKKINAKELSESLPRKLQALLKLGVFTATVRNSARNQAGDGPLAPLLQPELTTSQVPGPATPTNRPDQSHVESGHVSVDVSPTATTPKNAPSPLGLRKTEGALTSTAAAHEVGAITLDKVEKQPEPTALRAVAGNSTSVFVSQPPISSGGTGTGAGTPRRRGGSFMSTKRSASWHLRDKVLSGLVVPGTEGVARGPTSPPMTSPDGPGTSQKTALQEVEIDQC